MLKVINCSMESKLSWLVTFYNCHLFQKRMSHQSFLFQSGIWKRMNVCRHYLTHVYRQTDKKFIKLLRSIRCNSLDDKSKALLLSRVKPPPKGRDFIRLCNTKKEVLEFNCVKTQRD